MDNGAESYRRYLNGDESAFAEVQRLYFENLMLFINRYVNDMAAAEDLAIDAMVELVIHPHRYDFKTPLKTWLFAIGRHKALDYVRHRSRLKIVELSEADRMYDDGGVPGNCGKRGMGDADGTYGMGGAYPYAGCDPLEEKQLADERKRALNAALGKLPEHMRAAVHLVYFEGMSYADAARVMKKTKKQIDNLLYRGKTELRKILGEEAKELL